MAAHAPKPDLSHRDISDEIVRRAQLYDYEHFREDCSEESGGLWGSVPPDQVRRLIWGAFCVIAALEARIGASAAELGSGLAAGLKSELGSLDKAMTRLSASMLDAEIRQGIAEAERGETKITEPDDDALGEILGTLQAAFPWMCHLPPGGRRAFAAEIAAWRGTAEIYADPELLKRATRPCLDGEGDD